MPDYLNIAGRVRTTAADGVVAEAQEVKDILKNKSQQELNNDFSTAIEAILLLIPSGASSLNQLADKAFVNSSIATASATFRGTYNLVSDLNLTVSATHAQIGAALAGAVSDEDNNDYAFVQVPTSDATPTQIAKTERYKFNGTTWEYEYDLNNSGYTDSQWAAINSGITAALVSKLSALPTNAELTTALGLLSDGIAAINGKIPSEATTSNKLVDTAAMQSYITQIINAIDATFNVTSTDGHVTVQITQVNGVITSVAVTTSDIASASALTLVTGRVTDAEANIVSLGGRMTTAETDIDDLQQLYNNLQQSDPIVIAPTDTWPVANPSTHAIYRVVDRVNTPPEYYSDYMFRASDLTTPVLMATYNNAIDPRPKKGSQNLVTSGGVFDNMGALDVSELNATENPHTLATYADLSAALAAIPSDYQKGGMSVKFVLSSDNKYVQYRYMGTDTTGTPNSFLDISNWEGGEVYPALFGMKRTSNMFDFRNAKYHIRFSKTDGTPFQTSNGWSTGYIDVTGAEKIYMNYLCEYAVFYDANKDFLSTDNRILYKYPVPSNAKFVILNFMDERAPYSYASSLMVSSSEIEELESYYSEFTKSHPLISDYRTASGDCCLLVCDQPIDINFVTNKITFPNSSNIYLYYRREKYEVPANTVVNLDLSFGSGYITFDVVNKTFASRRYGYADKQHITENEIFVFAISNYNVVLDCPYTINGQSNTDVSTYEEKSGIVDYDTTWWKVGTSNYKYAIIPIVSENSVISISAARAQTFMVGLKSYQEPTQNGAIQNLSDVWVRRIEIPIGQTLDAVIPSDVKYIALNVLYNNEQCISDFSIKGNDNSPLNLISKKTEHLQHITIASQNVRDFGTGTGDGCPEELVDTNLPLWKEHVSKWLNQDFLCLNEFYDYFDENNTIDAYNTLFKQFFPYHYELNHNVLLSKYSGVLTNLQAFGSSLHFDMPMLICNVCGKKAAIVCWLQSSSDTPQTRIAAYNSAISILSDFDIVIVAGDFNTEQGLSELSAWTSAGYTLGNGGYWGEIKTWEDQTPNDNIIAKGVIYECFEKGEKVSSDHNAVRAKLGFMV